MIKYKNYNNDDLHSELTEEAQRRERLAQSAIRIEQKAHHMKIQEEKIKQAKERRRAEEIEKRNAKLKKILTLYHLKKVLVSAAEIASALATILALLKIASANSQVAASAYNGIIQSLETVIVIIKNGASIPVKLIMGILNAISKAVRYVFRVGRHDSKMLNDYIHKDLKNKINAACNKRVDENFYSNDNKNKIASRYVNFAIRINDKKHNDIVGAVASVGILKGVILPLLLTILKSGTIAGVAMSISGPLQKKVTDPIISRIVNNIQLAIINKGDKTYTEAILGKIKSDMNTLMNILSRERSFVIDKLRASWDRIKDMV